MGPPPADPVVEIRTQTRTVCPADLQRDAGDEPRPAAGAVIRHNEAGGDYLDALIAWGKALADIVTASRQACDQIEGAGE